MVRETSSLERRRLLVERFPTPRPCLFLDRDGVLIEDKHHLSDPARVELIRGAKELLEASANAGWPTIIITNQSGISRKLFGWAEYERVTDQMLKLIDINTSLAAIYANGNGPNASKDSWRKPSPAMLREAERELNLDLSNSILVGDRLTDLIAGKSAGLARLCHVNTSSNTEERAAVETWSKKNNNQHDGKAISKVFLFEDIFDVVHALGDWLN